MVREEARSRELRAAATWLCTSTVLDVGLLTPLERKALRALYPLMSGLLGSWTVLFTKCIGEMSKSSARESRGADWLYDPRTAVLVGGVAFTMPLQLCVFGIPTRAPFTQEPSH